VYNIGGGRQNSISILEAFARIELITGKAMKYTYVDTARAGDHICYYSDLTKMLTHYPTCSVSRSLDLIFEEVFTSWRVLAASIT
jgi:CDP-paratose 2-epimerase